MSPLDLEAVFEKVTPEPGSPGSSRLRMGLRARLGSDRSPAAFDRVLAAEETEEVLARRSPGSGTPLRQKRIGTPRTIDVTTPQSPENWLIYTRSGFGVPLGATPTFEQPGAYLDLRA